MTGNPLIDKIVMGINGAGLLAGLGLFIFTTFVAKRPLPQEALELERLKDEAKNQSTLETYKMESIVINLESSGSTLRFLDVQMELLPFKARQLEAIDKVKPIIYDKVIDLTGKMPPEELNTVAGKVILEDKLKRSLNQAFAEPTIKKIFFTKFVIQ